VGVGGVADHVGCGGGGDGAKCGFCVQDQCGYTPASPPPLPFSRNAQHDARFSSPLRAPNAHQACGTSLASSEPALSPPLYSAHLMCVRACVFVHNFCPPCVSSPGRLHGAVPAWRRRNGGGNIHRLDPVGSHRLVAAPPQLRRARVRPALLSGCNAKKSGTDWPERLRPLARHMRAGRPAFD
jgi:hypothetical protein